MAIQTGPGAPEAERLISSGGNVYSLYWEPVKRGVATQGRGYWVARKRGDDQEPDVDNPLGDGLEVHSLEGAMDDPDDGFEDNKDPMLALYRKDTLAHANRVHQKHARSLVQMGSSQVFGKSAVLTIGGLKMDMILQEPSKLDRDGLFKSANRVKLLMETGSFVGEENELLRVYAGKIAKALRELVTAEREVAKAILTKPDSEKDAEEKKRKEAKRPPEKAQQVKQDANGKTQYKYPKNGDGKGPQSDGAQPQQAQAPHVADAQEDPEQVSAPPKIDPSEFCQRIGIAEKQIQKLADKKTRQEFTQFFMAAEEVVEKHKINPAFLGALYDSLTHPETQNDGEAPAPGKQPALPQQGGTPGMPPMLGKSLVVFSAGTLHGPTLAVMDMLKSHKARTVSDIRKCIQTHYAVTEDVAVKATRTLLNRWERTGLVKLYPVK